MFVQETLNYWKQLSQVMKFFRDEEDSNARLPKNFITGFLEVRCFSICPVSVLIFQREGIESMETIISLYIAPNPNPTAPLLCN
jgi:hypothetical protein